MPSPAAMTLIEMYAGYRLAPAAPSRSFEELRAMSAQMTEAQAPVTDATIDSQQLGGVATERTRAHGVDAGRIVVYVHGGGYVCGSASGQRGFLAALAREAAADVYAVDYRLAPEHPYPAAVDDVVDAYVAAVALSGGRPVIVGGDSAGGGLAVGAVVEMRDRGIALPAAIFALSPWADMTLGSGALNDLADRDVMVRVNDLTEMRTWYLGARDPEVPQASPALADLAGLPPMLVQVGADEILLGDSQLLVDRAVAAGIDARIDVADGMFHTYQVLAPQLPESREAIASLARFVVGATGEAS